MNVLFLMLARGGSKGIPNKNLTRICNQSLIGYKAIGARRSKYCQRILLSTDSEAIRAEAAIHGVEAPFLRPQELATDQASATDAVLHSMQWVEENLSETFDAIMLLEPTTPFTRYHDYDGAIELMAKHDSALVVGMRETEVSSVFVGPMDAQGRITQIIDQIHSLASHRRQDREPEFTMNGALYLIRWDVLKETRQIYVDRERSFGYVMDSYYSVEIDRPIDLAWAEFLITNGYVDRSYWI